VNGSAGARRCARRVRSHRPAPWAATSIVLGAAFRLSGR
jgi:hypothetical protein